MVYTLRFFPLQNEVFHNSNVFGPCIIHTLYTGCAKMKKYNSGAKRLITPFYIFFKPKLALFTNICVLKLYIVVRINDIFRVRSMKTAITQNIY